MFVHAPPSGSRSGLSKLVLERRSTRIFTGEDVPLTIVKDLLAAAAWAPSPHNSQPWRFTVLSGSEDKSNLAGAMARQLAADLQADGIEYAVIQRQTTRSRERISSAPVVILCSLTRDGLADYADAHRNGLEWKMAEQSVGAVLQTLFLLAHERGLGTCWMAAPMYCPDVVRHVLELAPVLAPQALVLMGNPAVPGKARERRPMDELVDLR